MTEWLATKPFVTRPPIYCETRLRTYLNPGTFVIFDPPEDDAAVGQSKLLIRCIVEAKNCSDHADEQSFGLVINLFQVLDESQINELIICPIQDICIRDIPEIVQTERCLTVPTNSVTSIAFVFSLGQLEQNEAMGCNGMDTLFLLRYRIDTQPVHPEWCLPYPSYYPAYHSNLPDCYLSRIWNALKVIRSEITHLMGCYSEKQGLYNTVCSKVTLNNETWEYFLVSKVSHVIGLRRTAIKTSVKWMLLPGLTLKSVRLISNILQMIRFETLHDLHALTNVFGQQVLIEVRKRRPAAINSPSELQVHDAINIVVGSKDRSAPFQEIGGKDDGMDLTFDGKSELRICIRYRKYQFEVSPSNGNPKNCPILLKRFIKRMQQCDDDP